MKNPNNCDTSKLRKEIKQALRACEYVYSQHRMEFELYHTYDGKHKEGSLHFKNRAFDGGLPSVQPEQVFAELRALVGVEYDVVAEIDHLHVEWDPK